MKKLNNILNLTLNPQIRKIIISRILSLKDKFMYDSDDSNQHMHN